MYRYLLKSFLMMVRQEFCWVNSWRIRYYAFQALLGYKKSCVCAKCHMLRESIAISLWPISGLQFFSSTFLFESGSTKKGKRDVLQLLSIENQ